MLRWPVYLLRVFFCLLRNGLCRLGRAPDYVSLVLEGPYALVAPPPRRWPMRWLDRPKPDVREIRRRMRAISKDRRVRGVVLRLYRLGGPTAALQSLREGIAELQARGKRVLAWAHSYGMEEYYVACAADEVLLQHGGHVGTVGLTRTYTYLADALERIGLAAEIVQISPYKTAGDVLTRRSMSDAAREMANWLIDDAYRQHLEGIAAGRGLSTDEARKLIDGAPYVGEAAVDAGAVDAILGEEELRRQIVKLRAGNVARHVEADKISD